jgi:prephenate dehydrogenase
MTQTYDPILAVMQRRRARDSFVHSETRVASQNPEVAQAVLALNKRVEVLEAFIRDAAAYMESKSNG